MNVKNDSTGEPGSASASANPYAAMSVWDQYEILNTLIGIRQFYNLTLCGQKTGDTAVFGWAEDREAEVDSHIDAIAKNLASLLGLHPDDEDVRDMAFARIDGYVPAGYWIDGRLQRMRSAADLAVAR